MTAHPRSTPPFPSTPLSRPPVPPLGFTVPFAPRGGAPGAGVWSVFPPPQPQAQRLGSHTKLPRNRADRRPLRRILAPVLLHQPHRAVSHFLGVPASSVHRSILSQHGASTFPGAVHLNHRGYLGGV